MLEEYFLNSSVLNLILCPNLRVVCLTTEYSRFLLRYASVKLLRWASSLCIWSICEMLYWICSVTWAKVCPRGWLQEYISHSFWCVNELLINILSWKEMFSFLTSYLVDSIWWWWWEDSETLFPVFKRRKTFCWKWGNWRVSILQLFI